MFHVDGLNVPEPCLDFSRALMLFQELMMLRTCLTSLGVSLRESRLASQFDSF